MRSGARYLISVHTGSLLLPCTIWVACAVGGTCSKLRRGIPTIPLLYASTIHSCLYRQDPFRSCTNKRRVDSTSLPHTPHSKVRKACAALTWQASNHMILLVVHAAASAKHSHIVHRCGQVGVDGGELDLRARQQHEHRIMIRDGCVQPLQATSIFMHQTLGAFQLNWRKGTPCGDGGLL